MKRLLVLAMVSIVMISLMTGCGGVKTYVDVEKTINTSLDQEFIIALDSDPTTGYDWEESYDESMLGWMKWKVNTFQMKRQPVWLALAGDPVFPVQGAKDG